MKNRPKNRKPTLKTDTDPALLQAPTSSETVTPLKYWGRMHDPVVSVSPRMDQKRCTFSNYHIDATVDIK